jgi:hypothetical protein
LTSKRYRPLGRHRRRWEDNIKKLIFKKYGVKMGTEFIWLKTGTSELSDSLRFVASEEGVCSMELVH